MKINFIIALSVLACVTGFAQLPDVTATRWVSRWNTPPTAGQTPATITVGSSSDALRLTQWHVVPLDRCNQLGAEDFSAGAPPWLSAAANTAPLTGYLTPSTGTTWGVASYFPGPSYPVAYFGGYQATAAGPPLYAGKPYRFGLVASQRFPGNAATDELRLAIVRKASRNVSGLQLTVGGVTFANCEAMIAGNSHQLRVRGSISQLQAITNNAVVSGRLVPTGSSVTGVLLDNLTSPTSAVLTINNAVTIGSPIGTVVAAVPTSGQEVLDAEYVVDGSMDLPTDLNALAASWNKVAENQYEKTFVTKIRIYSAHTSGGVSAKYDEFPVMETTVHMVTDENFFGPDGASELTPPNAALADTREGAEHGLHSYPMFFTHKCLRGADEYGFILGFRGDIGPSVTTSAVPWAKTTASLPTWGWAYAMDFVSEPDGWYLRWQDEPRVGKADVTVAGDLELPGATVTSAGTMSKVAGSQEVTIPLPALPQFQTARQGMPIFVNFVESGSDSNFNEGNFIASISGATLTYSDGKTNSTGATITSGKSARLLFCRAPLTSAALSKTSSAIVTVNATAHTFLKGDQIRVTLAPSATFKPGVFTITSADTNSFTYSDGQIASGSATADIAYAPSTVIAAGAASMPENPLQSWGVVALDGQQGLPLQPLAGAKGAPDWLTKTTNTTNMPDDLLHPYVKLVTTPQFQLGWQVDYYPYRYPIAYFGDGTGTPLYAGKPYRFGLVAGSQLAGDDTVANDLKIFVYNKSTGAALAITDQSDFIDVPNTEQIKNGTWQNNGKWAPYGDKGFQTTVVTRVSGVPVLETTIQLVSKPVAWDQWGAPPSALASMTTWPLFMTHKCLPDGKAYGYAVGYKGIVAAYGTTPTSLPWTLKAHSTASLSSQKFNAEPHGMAYAMDFSDEPLWRTQLLETPQFQGMPMPQSYHGSATLDVIFEKTKQLTTSSKDDVQILPTPVVWRNVKNALITTSERGSTIGRGTLASDKHEVFAETAGEISSDGFIRFRVVDGITDQYTGTIFEFAGYSFWSVSFDPPGLWTDLGGKHSLLSKIKKGDTVEIRRTSGRISLLVNSVEISSPQAWWRNYSTTLPLKLRLWSAGPGISKILENCVWLGASGTSQDTTPKLENLGFGNSISDDSDGDGVSNSLEEIDGTDLGNQLNFASAIHWERRRNTVDLLSSETPPKLTGTLQRIQSATSGSHWNADAQSSSPMIGDGTLSFRAGQNTALINIGIASSISPSVVITSDATTTLDGDIQAGFALANGTFTIIGATDPATLPTGSNTYTSATSFRLERKNGIIKYYKDGQYLVSATSAIANSVASTAWVRAAFAAASNTSPLIADAHLYSSGDVDADGLPDDWERSPSGGNLGAGADLAALRAFKPNDDSDDSDGATNREEFAVGTLPLRNFSGYTSTTTWLPGSGITVNETTGGLSRTDGFDLTSAKLALNVATLTTQTDHGFTLNQTVIVALSPPDPVFDGPHVITAIPDATSFSFAKTYTGSIERKQIDGAVYHQYVPSGAITDRRMYRDGAFWFKPSRGDRNLMVGLDVYETSTNYATDLLDFAVKLDSAGRALAYYKGSQKQELGSYVAGDEFGLVRRNGRVSIWKNGTKLHSFDEPNMWEPDPLFVQLSLPDRASGISSGRFNRGDRDGDGMADAWEITSMNLPVENLSDDDVYTAIKDVFTPEGDYDADGTVNRQEYWDGTNGGYMWDAGTPVNWTRMRNTTNGGTINDNRGETVNQDTGSVTQLDDPPFPALGRAGNLMAPGDAQSSVGIAGDGWFSFRFELDGATGGALRWGGVVQSNASINTNNIPGTYAFIQSGTNMAIIDNGVQLSATTSPAYSPQPWNQATRFRISVVGDEIRYLIDEQVVHVATRIQDVLLWPKVAFSNASSLNSRVFDCRMNSVTDADADGLPDEWERSSRGYNKPDLTIEELSKKFKPGSNSDDNSSISQPPTGGYPVGQFDDHSMNWQEYASNTNARTPLLGVLKPVTWQLNPSTATGNTNGLTPSSQQNGGLTRSNTAPFYNQAGIAANFPVLADEAVWFKFVAGSQLTWVGLTASTTAGASTAAGCDPTSLTFGVVLASGTGGSTPDHLWVISGGKPSTWPAPTTETVDSLGQITSETWIGFVRHEGEITIWRRDGAEGAAGVPLYTFATRDTRPLLIDTAFGGQGGLAECWVLKRNSLDADSLPDEWELVQRGLADPNTTGHVTAFDPGVPDPLIDISDDDVAAGTGDGTQARAEYLRGTGAWDSATRPLAVRWTARTYVQADSDGHLSTTPSTTTSGAGARSIIGLTKSGSVTFTGISTVNETDIGLSDNLRSLPNLGEQFFVRTANNSFSLYHMSDGTVIEGPINMGVFNSTDEFRFDLTSNVLSDASTQQYVNVVINGILVHQFTRLGSGKLWAVARSYGSFAPGQWSTGACYIYSSTDEDGDGVDDNWENPLAGNGERPVSIPQNRAALQSYWSNLDNYSPNSTSGDSDKLRTIEEFASGTSPNQTETTIALAPAFETAALIGNGSVWWEVETASTSTVYTRRIGLARDRLAAVANIPFSVELSNTGIRVLLSNNIAPANASLTKKAPVLGDKIGLVRRDGVITVWLNDSPVYEFDAEDSGKLFVTSSSSGTPPAFANFYAYTGDSDGDDIPDFWELLLAGNSTTLGSGDADGDGVSDYDEYLAATNPLDNRIDSSPGISASNLSTDAEFSTPAIWTRLRNTSAVFDSNLTGATTTLESPQITVASTSGLVPGTLISGRHIVPGTRINSVTDGTTLELDQAALATESGLTLKLNTTGAIDATSEAATAIT